MKLLAFFPVTVFSCLAAVGQDSGSKFPCAATNIARYTALRDAYYELEINAFNTCYEAFFVWEDTFFRSGLSKLPEFDRFKLAPFNGVGFTNHFRGGRLGNFNHTLPGLKTGVWLRKSGSIPLDVRIKHLNHTNPKKGGPSSIPERWGGNAQKLCAPVQNRWRDYAGFDTNERE
jgi:hypothetical protein